MFFLHSFLQSSQFVSLRRMHIIHKLSFQHSRLRPSTAAARCAEKTLLFSFTETISIALSFIKKFDKLNA